MDDFDGPDLVDLDPVSIVAKVALKAAVKTVFNKGIEAYENKNQPDAITIKKDELVQLILEANIDEEKRRSLLSALCLDNENK